MSTDLKAIMRRDERRRKMLNDPDLTGDLLLFALCLDEAIATRKEQGRKRMRNWVAEVAALAYRADSAYHQRYWSRSVIRGDAPRYEPDGFLQGRYLCVAPMIRRDGLCGKKSAVRWLDPDPMTGVSTPVGMCSRHRGGELEAYYDRRRREWVANGKPSPPANRGGVLKRYFNAPWEEIYRWSGREPMEGGREATPPRPVLRLIRGGDEEVSEDGC